MDDDLEEHVFSILRGRRGCDESYHSISEFKRNLKGGATLAEEELERGWVLWNSEHYATPPLHQTITHLLKRISSNIWLYGCVVQFWAVVNAEGRYHYLYASHQPFYIPHTYKSHCRYRNLCVDQLCVVDMEEGAEEEPLGGVGRAYRNKHPESTPDLRLYSLSEFPLRDEAARSGFRAYLALPLFDQTQCYGVLEVLSCYTTMRNMIPRLNEGLQADKYNHKPEKEITEILELCIKFVPELSLAQVWIPCKQCPSKGSTVICRERTSFITARGKRVNSCQNIDQNLYDYLQGCQFHNLPVLKCGSLYDVSISKDPLSHYARRARLSHCFAVHIGSVSDKNETYALQFLLQSKDASGDSSVHLLLRIIEMKLKRFKFLAREQIPVELDIHSTQFDGINILDVMNSHLENFSEGNFIEYMETADLCCLQSSSRNNRGWVFGLPYKDVEMNKIVKFMKIIANDFWAGSWMVQFWAPKMVDDKCSLETSTQPYALGCLGKGLASFRKKCLKHDYFVDEEVGPPGRVFRNGHPETSPNILLYSKKDFPMRNYAVNCGLSQYFALPVFNGNNHKCVGVLELTGFNYLDLNKMTRLLKAAGFYSPHIDFCPIYLTNGDTNTIHLKKKALNEVADALRMITKIPQLHLVNVWVPTRECVGTHSYLSCMELALSSKTNYDFVSMDQIHWIHIHPKKGIIGMVLASENKSCFCRNISEFSIADNPLSHYEMSEKGNICFAICLQSSHTGDLLYVLQFFLYEGPETYKNLHSFLNFLMPVMNKELPTFKVANGKELGQELVVDVIEFSESNTPISYDYELDQPCVFPIKFKSVFYGQQEHQYIEERHDIELSQPNQSTFPESDQLNLPPKNQCIEEPQVQYNLEGEQRKEDNVVSNLKKTKKGKRKRVSLEELESNCHKTLEEAALDIGVSRSTMKRAVKKHGFKKWREIRKQARNSCLSDGQQDMRPSVQDASKDKKDNLIVVDDDGDDDIWKDLVGFDTLQGPLENGVQKVRCIDSLPEALKMLCICFKHLSDGRGIPIALDDDVFCNKCDNIYIHQEDFIPFCNLEPISGNCIVVYIWYLYSKMDKNTLRRFQFVNPFAISHVPKSKLDRRADALVDRFNSTSPNQILLAPCNVGKHWILTIIQPYKEIAMLLDPIAHNHYESWKNVVNMAISKFNDNLGKKGKEQPTWEVIKAPRQPDNKQCGYYVMRYMKEIVEGVEMIDFSSLNSLSEKEKYSQTEINEVRDEWGRRVQKHVPNVIYWKGETVGLTTSLTVNDNQNGNKRPPENEVQKNVPHANMESKNVTVKVTYGEDTIKFELCLSLGVSKLFQEVERRLISLKMSTFKLKYKDDDGDEILITCNDDLQLCAKSRTAMDKGYIQLFVHKQV